ncbi:MAG: helix-turn-helix transcriptional regulator [Myxococcota bacterium]|nr:helix-turn-helix transcriptional regulator [Myxococcota bacterium]
MTQAVIVKMALKILANRLKRIRTERGLSQADLAERSGLKVNDISRYERGAVSPNLENFVKIANALEVSADTLLFDGTSPASSEEPKNLKLWQRLQDVGTLDKNDQDAVIRLIDAMIAKKKMKDVVGG